MDTTQRRTVVGVFDEPRQAQRAVDALHDAGFTDEQIGFIRRGGETVEGTTPIDTGAGHPSVRAGLGTGAVIGGVLGAAAALLIPGVGPVLAGGVIAHPFGASLLGGAVVGAAAGAVAGGLLGALTDMGVPEEDARYANEQFEAGRTIVTVAADIRFAEAIGILHDFGAHDVRSDRSGATGTTMPTTSYQPAGSAATIAPVPSASNPPIQSAMRKETMTEREAGAKEIRVPVTEEKLVTQKHEEQTGAEGWRTTRSWSEVMPTYRTAWQQRSGTTGGRWDEVEPAYRFGFESSSGSAYQGRSWDQSEMDLRRDWITRDPRTPWEKVKDAVRDAWDRAHTGI